MLGKDVENEVHCRRFRTLQSSGDVIASLQTHMRTFEEYLFIGNISGGKQNLNSILRPFT